MATACKLRGLAGVVIDGSCRDSEDIRELVMWLLICAIAIVFIGGVGF